MENRKVIWERRKWTEKDLNEAVKYLKRNFDTTIDDWNYLDKLIIKEVEENWTWKLDDTALIYIKSALKFMWARERMRDES